MRRCRKHTKRRVHLTASLSCSPHSSFYAFDEMRRLRQCTYARAHAGGVHDSAAGFGQLPVKYFIGSEMKSETKNDAIRCFGAFESKRVAAICMRLASTTNCSGSSSWGGGGGGGGGRARAGRRSGDLIVPQYSYGSDG